MKPLGDRIEDFQGVRRDVSKIRLPRGLFQEDEGGDRYNKGAWRRRRGMLHTSVGKQGSAVTALIGMDLPGSDYSLLLVEGANAQGFANVTVQANTVTPITTGYGVLGYGEGGYGG